MTRTSEIERERLVPVRAQLQGATAEQADQVTDWAGQRARAVVAGPARLPELAADGDDVDGFDPETMTGEIEAFPTVLGRPYRMGFFTWHQIEPGAFDDSLGEQDGRIPIYVQHNWDWTERPPIGHTREAAEVDFSDGDGDTRAVRIAGRLYPDVQDGLAVLHAMAARALREWSIGYLIEEYTAEDDDESGRTIIHVVRAQLWEGSVVLRGANPWTGTENVASAGASRLTRAAQLLDVTPEHLEAALAAANGGDEPSDVDTDPEVAADLQARVNRLLLREAAPAFSRNAHRLREERA